MTDKKGDGAPFPTFSSAERQPSAAELPSLKQLKREDHASRLMEPPSYIFEYTPTEVLTSGREVFPEVQIENDFQIETTRFNGGVFVRLPKMSGGDMFRRCQDAGALGLDKNNMISNFAMGDGVGQSINGKAASERATSLALRELILSGDVSYTPSALKDVVKKVEERMQGFDIEELKLQWAQAILNKHSENPRVVRRLLVPLGYGISSGKLEKKSTSHEDEDIDNSLGSTTLVVGKLEGSHIKMAYAGDGGFIIANSDRVKAFGGQHAEVKAPAQLRLAGGKIDINQVQYFDIELSKGDMVLIYSDGLYCTAIGGEVSSEFRAKQVVSLIRSGNSVEQIVKSLTSDAAGGDDIEVLAFKYGG